MFAWMGLMASCSQEKLEDKGFPVRPILQNNDVDQVEGIQDDSLQLETRPGNVLLTGIPNIRLTTVYKVNINKDDNQTFIGSNTFHYRYEESEDDRFNNWNDHIMPGIEAVYGYNMVNVSHYDIRENKKISFFEKPVLIKTLYYPAFSKDTLNGKPASRDYFLVSVYNDDTNHDGFINLKDLRRFYLFNLNGNRAKALVPENYSVLKSEYDPGNDFMYVFAQLDADGNGARDEGEPIHIFWIDLKNPNRTGQQY